MKVGIWWIDIAKVTIKRFKGSQVKARRINSAIVATRWVNNAKVAVS